MTVSGSYLSRALILRVYAAARERGVYVATLAPAVGVPRGLLMSVLNRSHAPRRRDSAVSRLRRVGEALAREVGHQGEVLERVELRPIGE